MRPEAKVIETVLSSLERDKILEKTDLKYRLLSCLFSTKTSDRLPCLVVFIHIIDLGYNTLLVFDNIHASFDLIFLYGIYQYHE